MLLFATAQPPVTSVIATNSILWKRQLLEQQRKGQQHIPCCLNRPALNMPVENLFIRHEHYRIFSPSAFACQHTINILPGSYL